MFKQSAKRLLSYSLRRTQQSNALTSPSVTLVLDKKPVTLSFDNEKQSLNSFLSDVNSHIADQSAHYDVVENSATGLALDQNQSLAEIFAATNSIALSSSSNNSQVVITRPTASAPSLPTINDQEVIRMVEELNKRLQAENMRNNLRAEAVKLDEEIQPMYEKLRQLEKSTSDGADYTLLGFLSVWTMTTVSIGRLTWWEFSWDIMEPVAWATQAGAMLFWGWYYFITRNENSMSDIAGRIKNKKLVRKLEKTNFDTQKYNSLIERRQEVDTQLAKFDRF